MHTIGTAFYSLKDLLQPMYDEREAAAIAHELLQHLTGLSKTERLMRKDNQLTDIQQQQYDTSVALIISGTPLQHLTGTAWFMGYEYNVNKHVLIPRPETEELVNWIVTDVKNTISDVSILDIGTGSGCIPVSLKQLLPNAQITSCDLSEDALSVARGNTAKHNVEIDLRRSDFLDESAWSDFDTYDVIVSNPPYIPQAQSDKLHINVSRHEPHMALFVPDNNPLVFYEAIAKFGLSHLKAGGRIFCELDAEHAFETKEVFEKSGYKNVTIKKDMHNNYRMLRAEAMQKA